VVAEDVEGLDEGLEEDLSLLGGVQVGEEPVGGHVVCGFVGLGGF
jgi:hypothetical protein